MDIEDYLKQKRELERKKDVLEAKERLKEVREEPKRPVREPIAPQEPQSEPTLKPWMIWDMLMLIIVMSLFATAYFFPQYNAEKIKEIIKADPTLITGSAILQQSQTTAQQGSEQNTQTTTEQSQQTNELPKTQTPHKETPEQLPGPEFQLKLKDRTLGDFDRDGKIDDQIVEIISSSQSARYEDLIIEIKNDESEQIQCEVDKDIKIDTDFDNTPDARDYGRVATLELDPNSNEEKRETIPADPEEGSYLGRGRLTASYKAKCFFCIDNECNAVEKDGKSEKTATAKIIIRATNSTG